MRLATLSPVALLIVTLGGLTPPDRQVHAAPPAPPPEFAQPQSPPKPEPFPVHLVDQRRLVAPLAEIDG